MSHQDITYVFRDNKTYAIRQGKVIASHVDPAEVERLVKQAYGEDPHADYMDHGGGGGDPDAGYEGEYGPQLGGDGSCPGCGAPGRGTRFCPDCGASMSNARGGQDMEEPYPHDEPSPGLEMGGEAGSYMAKVVTPNGIKGTVLGKVASTWGDEVTIRLENGRIVHLPVGTDLKAHKEAATAPRSTPIDRLEARLASMPDGTRESLVARHNEVTRIASEVTEMIREGVSYADSVRLDQIHVAALNEGLEIVAAVEHLDEVDRIEAPRSFTMAAAKEAAGISREDASWLDHTLDEMIKEAEATDFTKLMDEGPEAFTAELPDVALADTGVTRQMASHFISEKTAGIERTVAEPYMTTFLARVEECRRTELTGRKQTTHKEAAATEDKYKDLPDESLFL